MNNNQVVPILASGTMETEEINPDVTIKNEIDIEEEKIIRVSTEHAKVPANVNLYESLQVEIKQETECEPNNYLIERNDKTDKPTVVREPEVNRQAHIDARIKEEQDESIVSYDFPTFDDAGSMDSSEAEALGNVETSLQDDIKTENGGHQNSYDYYQDKEVKIEPEIVPEINSSIQITPDMPDTGPKYSFVMKLPGEVLNNIHQIVASYNNDTNNAEALPAGAVYPGGESNDDAISKLNNTTVVPHTDQSSLLEATDQSKIYDLNPFQLNSITGNVLSLEQEALIMLQPKKNAQCPKCPKKYRSPFQLYRHAKVHQTIENYENGRKRARETAKKNRMARIHLLKQRIDEHDSQDSCSQQHEVKEEKGGYKCTCGKSFQRKTRMESCLRTHDFSESEKFYCMTCLKDFKSKDELALHRKRLHRKKFPCKFCPTDYATRKKLFRHLQIHQKVHQMEYKVIEETVKSKKKLRCFFCSNCYEDIAELKIHAVSEHTGPYSCPHCRNTFPKIIDFGNHTKTYHPEVGHQSVLDVLEAFSRLTQEWKCEECDLQFWEADKLALHQVEQHNPEIKTDNQFQCPDCRRVFISQKGLTSHRRIHHSTETTEQAKEEVTGIMCLECRKMCKDMSALTSHMRFHSPDRKYPCKFCDFRFATPEKRKVHAEIHTGDMKFVCFICEYQCSSENRLKKHKQSLKHANMSEYLLTGKPLIEEPSSKDKIKKEGSAKKRKKSKDCSKSDMDTSCSSEVRCDVCGEAFPSEALMLEHKETHPFIEIPSAETDKPTRIFFK
ncbi:hypothetical protein NE865_16197 [Phthorimaea operculella]|nr:hypothetical protein NE865_16197 [Phthorimaea operculella]